VCSERKKRIFAGTGQKEEPKIFLHEDIMFLQEPKIFLQEPAIIIVCLQNRNFGTKQNFRDSKLYRRDSK